VTTDQPSVAVLGTGIMGAPIARNIAAAGLETRAWNRTRAKAEPLAEHGVTVADTAGEAVDGADLVVTMLANGDAVEHVMTDGGALEAMGDDAIWVQMSTVGIAATERLSQLAEERGITFVDAPVLGTKQPAEDGALTVLGSGPEGSRDACQPVFDAIGSRTVWLGEAGAGTRLKLVVNNWLVNLLADLAETIALAKKIDVPPDAFLDAIDGSAVGAPYAQLKGAMMLKEDFPPSFPLGLALKDALLVVEAAERHGVELALTEATITRFKQAVELGHGDEDMAAIYYAAVNGRK
jgi:3-hydroxyisobutyrate dehydrogenase